MVGTPQLPLKYRRKGVRDYWVFTQHYDMQPHYSASSNSCRPGLEYSMPRSPSFYSSSSSIAPSSPIRSLYTPEPASPTLTQPFIASSPKSPRPQGRRGFWEVALNYCSDPPYMKHLAEQNTDLVGEQYLTRRRSSSSSAPTLVSDIEPSEYSEDYDPLHIDDEATDEENPGRVTVVNSREEFASDRPRVSHLPHEDIDETNDDKSLVGEMDVAAVLLDLSRQVRLGSIESKVENIEPASTPPINSVQQPAAVFDEYLGTDRQEDIVASPSTLENAVHTTWCDSAHDIQVTYLNKEETHRQRTDLEVGGTRSEASHTVSDVHVSISVAENGSCSTAEPKPLQDVDSSSEDVAMDNVDNALKINNQDNTCSVLEAAGSTINHDQKQDVDVTVESALSDSSALTPISSPAPTVSVLSELTEPLSGLSSPGFNTLELTGPCNDTMRSKGENDGLNMSPRPSSPVPGPSGHKFGSVDLCDLQTKVYGDKSQAPIKKIRRRKVLDAKTEENDRRRTEGARKKKRARSKTLAGSRLSSPFPSSSCSDLPRPRKKRSKRSTEDSFMTRHDDVSAQSSSLVQSASAGTLLPAHTASSSSTAQDLKVDTEPPTVAVDDSADANAELQGCLIQAMALSRASSMPVSSLVRDVLREDPHLSNQRSKEDWLKLASLVLQSHDVFGRIDREGLDAADKPLETQWFYIPENDPDQERASLLREMMPKKRNETKKHKQYFFKPLGKISRWDSEDAP